MANILLSSMPMIVCLFWTVFLLTNYIESHQRDKGRLALFFFVATMLYAGHYIFFNRHYSYLPISDCVYTYANLSVFPLYLHYICGLTTTRRHDLLLWAFQLPALMLTATVMLLYTAMSADDTQQFVRQFLYMGSTAGLSDIGMWQAVAHYICKVLFALQIIPVYIIGQRQIKQFERRVEANYADVESRSLRHIHFMLLLFAFVSVVSFISNLIGRHQFTDSTSLLALPSLIFSTFLYYIGYSGQRQNFSIDELESEYNTENSECPEHPEFSESTDHVTDHKEPTEEMQTTDTAEEKTLRRRIEHVMQQEHFFLKPNLKISDLASHLGTNRNYIYTAINVEMGLSFAEYINRQRIGYAKQLMQQKPDLLIQEVALKSGFSTTISFYRAFKRYAGQTPSEYVKTFSGK